MNLVAILDVRAKEPVSTAFRLTFGVLVFNSQIGAEGLR